MTRPVSEHDQPHIRSPLETAAPTSRLRRAGAQGAKPFYQSAYRAMAPIGSSTRIRQNSSGPGRFEYLLSVCGQAAFITAPSMTTPAVTYFHNATSSLRASATMVDFLK